MGVVFPEAGVPGRLAAPGLWTPWDGKGVDIPLAGVPPVCAHEGLAPCGSEPICGPSQFLSTPSGWIAFLGALQHALNPTFLELPIFQSTYSCFIPSPTQAATCMYQGLGY